MSDLPTLLARAIERHREGRWEEALADYRQVLAQQPMHADANHKIGVLLFQQGDIQAAHGSIHANHGLHRRR